MKQTFEKRTIDLDRVRQNSIVLLDLDQPLSETIFQQEYQTAVRLIDEIIQRSKKFEEDRSNPEASKKSYGYTDMQTAVPFIGDRGTGKTSMMVSVCNWLKQHSRDFQSTQLEDTKFIKDTKFICLDMIDAGKLQGSEDVLEIILSRLLSYLQENNQDRCNRRADYRELYKKIDFLYKDLARIHWSKGPKAEEASLLQLQAIADSQKTSEQFRELIQEFAKTVGGDRTFLVIALDDIDMYQGSRRNGTKGKFILLEQIYNYLRAPNLILLLTYNETILRQSCLDHFRRLCADPEEIKKDSVVTQQDVEGLTRQFLTKLFPHEQRVYLPDFMRIASMNQVNLYIVPKINKKTIPPFDKENQDFSLDPAPVNVKEFMLRLIAYRTGVYYDIKGNKKHFFEPRNLRELGSMIQVLEEMKEIPDKGTKEQIESARAQNRQMLLNYLYNQFSEDHLNREEYYAFSQLCMLPVFRQNREFIDTVSQYIGANRNKKQEEKRKAYSYGEMLRNIYDSTRGEIGLAYYSKEYIHCLLGTHSVILNQTAQIQQSQDEWMKLLGTSIAGSWANDMLPDVINIQENQYGRENEISGVGSIHLPANTFFELRLSEELYGALFCLAGCPNTGLEKADAEDKIGSLIEAMVLLGMFFTGFPKNGLHLKLHLGMTKGDPSTLKVTIKAGSLEYLCFNALNFVINSYLSTHAHSCCTVDGKNATYLEYIKKQLEHLGQSIVEEITNQKNFYILKIVNAQKRCDELTVEIQKLQMQRSSRQEALRKQLEDEIERRTAATWILQKCFGETKKKIQGLVRHAMKNSDNFATDEAFQNCVLQSWNQILNKKIGMLDSNGSAPEEDTFSKMIMDWKTNYEEKLFVFPIQQFDMSYNILKRLAHPDYYDREIPTDTGLSEAYDYFVNLYQSVESQLVEQDRVYCLKEEESFAKPYRDSVFYQRFVALANPKPSQSTGKGKSGADGPETSCLRTLFTEMLEQAIQGKATRENVTSGISGHNTLL